MGDKTLGGSGRNSDLMHFKRPRPLGSSKDCGRIVVASQTSLAFVDSAELGSNCCKRLTDGQSNFLKLLSSCAPFWHSIFFLPKFKCFNLNAYFADLPVQQQSRPECMPNYTQQLVLLLVWFLIYQNFSFGVTMLCNSGVGGIKRK